MKLAAMATALVAVPSLPARATSPIRPWRHGWIGIRGIAMTHHGCAVLVIGGVMR